MKNVWIVIVLAALLGASLPASAQFDFSKLNKLGDALKKGQDVAKKASEATRELTEAEEVEAGDGMAASFLGAVPLHPDAELQRYVNRVGRWVATQSRRPDLKWSFAVLDTPTINAFAVPGGTIFISVGLLKRLKSESELAGVLGHEVAHVMQRHHVKAIQAAAKTDLMKMIGSEVVDARSGASPLGKEGIKLLTSTGLTIMSKGLDKADEFEADRIGAVLAARAGYDPYGLVAVLQMLAAVKQEESGFSLMMSTHPTPNDRLTELEKFTSTLDRFAAQPQVEDRFAKVLAQLK
ncbi:MAG: M48 family metalloprotease [Burkholderiales bacterium]|jgi:predicted Zn-dependent protease|nr:M48 family metalloprotease [Nitrosomonadaceae bacterium]